MPPTDVERPAGPTRRDPAWLWALAALLLVARVASGIYEERHPPRLPDLMPWVPAADAPERSRMTGRPILYDFSAEWCGPCQRMQNEVFSDERHTTALAQLVVPVHVVDRQQEDGRNPALVDSLQRAHDVKSFPTLVVVGADGKAVDRAEGYVDAQGLMKWVGRASAMARLGAKSSKGAVKFTLP